MLVMIELVMFILPGRDCKAFGRLVHIRESSDSRLNGVKKNNKVKQKKEKRTQRR